MVKRAKGPFSMRLPLRMLDRLRLYAKVNGVTQSAAALIAMQRGLASMEIEADLSMPAATSPPAPHAPPPRRRVLSPGL